MMVNLAVEPPAPEVVDDVSALSFVQLNKIEREKINMMD
jgi:hypothetical protein